MSSTSCNSATESSSCIKSERIRTLVESANNLRVSQESAIHKVSKNKNTTGKQSPQVNSMVLGRTICNQSMQRLHGSKWQKCFMLLSVFNVFIRLLFVSNRQDFQFAHLNYKHFINSMEQSKRIDNNLTSEAKKLDAKRTKSRQNEMR